MLTRLAPKLAAVALASCAGGLVGFLLSSFLLPMNQETYSASLEGIFLSNREEEALASLYIQETSAESLLVLRVVPDIRSVSRSEWLSEVYNLGQEYDLDITEPTLLERISQGHVEVDNSLGLEFLRIRASSNSLPAASSLARRAFDDLEKLDEVFFPEARNPLSTISQSESDFPKSADDNAVDWNFLNFLALSNLDNDFTSPRFSADDNPITSGVEIALRDTSYLVTDEISTYVSFNGPRNWTLVIKGVNPQVVSKAITIAEARFRNVKLSSGGSWAFDGAVLPLASTGATSNQTSPAVSPVWTSTLSGLILGLVVGGLLWRKHENSSAPKNPSEANG